MPACRLARRTTCHTCSATSGQALRRRLKSPFARPRVFWSGQAWKPLLKSGSPYAASRIPRQSSGATSASRRGPDAHTDVQATCRHPDARHSFALALSQTWGSNGGFRPLPSISGMAGCGGNPPDVYRRSAAASLRWSGLGAGHPASGETLGTRFLMKTRRNPSCSARSYCDQPSRV